MNVAPVVGLRVQKTKRGKDCGGQEVKGREIILTPLRVRMGRMSQAGGLKDSSPAKNKSYAGEERGVNLWAARNKGSAKREGGAATGWGVRGGIVGKM